MKNQIFKYEQPKQNIIKFVCQSAPKVVADAKNVTKQHLIACVKYMKTELQSNQQLKQNLQQLLKQSSGSIFKFLPVKNLTLGSSLQVGNLIADLDTFKSNLKTIEALLIQLPDTQYYLKKLNDLKYDKLPQLQNELANNKNLSKEIKSSFKQISNKLMQIQLNKDVSSEKNFSAQIQSIISKFMKYGLETEISEINQIKSKTLKAKFAQWHRVLAYQFLYLNKQVKNNLNNFIKIMSTSTVSTKQITTTFHSLPERQKLYFEQLYCQVVRLKAIARNKPQKSPNPQKNKQEEEDQKEKEEMRKIQQISRTQMVKQRNESKAQLEILQDQMKKLKKILQDIAVHLRLSNGQQFTINADNCPLIYRDLLLQILNQFKKRTLFSQKPINKDKGTSQNYSKELNQNSILIESLKKQKQQFIEKIQILVNEKQGSLILIEDLKIQNQVLVSQKQQLKKANQRSKSTIFVVEDKDNSNKLQTEKYIKRNQDLTQQNQRLQKIVKQYDERKKEEISGQDKKSSEQRLRLQNQKLLKQIQELNNKIKNLMESNLLTEQRKKEQVQRKDRSTTELKEEIKTLKKETNENYCELEQMKRQSLQLSNKYNLLKDQNVSLSQSLNSALSNDKQKLNLQVSMIKQNEKNIILQLKKMELANKQLNSDLIQLKKQKNDLIRANQILISETMSRYQKTIEQIQDNYQMVNNNLTQLRSLNDEKQQMINQMRKMGNQKGEKIASLSIQLTRTQQQIQMFQAGRKEVNVYQ